MIAWSAGLFEGEGSFEINDRHGVRLRLNMTDLDVLERFADVVGCGNVREVTAPSVVRPHWRTCWSWSVARSADCERVINLWLPYLGQRRSQRAREALDLLERKEAARQRVCYCGASFRAKHKNQVYCCHEHQVNRAVA